jgi:hypothetical protein
MRKKQVFAFEIHGATPETVDTNMALRLASAYFDHLRRVSDAKTLDLSFQGLTVRKKCVRIEAMPNSLSVARAAAERTARIVRLAEPVPVGLEQATERLRHELRSLPASLRAKTVAGKWQRALRAPEPDAMPGPWEITELRITVVRVGGSEPTLTCASGSEVGSFTLRVSQDQARRLGAMLYSEVDVEAEIHRDESGHISWGRVMTIHELDSSPPSEAWRRWFASAASGWDDVEDIEAELGRTRG